MHILYQLPAKCEKYVEYVKNRAFYWSNSKKCAILRISMNEQEEDPMEQQKLDRINELAKKAKAEGLTPEEEAERTALRAEYIAAYRASLRSQLDGLRIQTPDGKISPLRKKQDGKPS